MRVRASRSSLCVRAAAGAFDVMCGVATFAPSFMNSNPARIRKNNFGLKPAFFYSFRPANYSLISGVHVFLFHAPKHIQNWVMTFSSPTPQNTSIVVSVLVFVHSALFHISHQAIVFEHPPPPNNAYELRIPICFPPRAHGMLWPLPSETPLIQCTTSMSLNQCFSKHQPAINLLSILNLLHLSDTGYDHHVSSDIPCCYLIYGCHSIGCTKFCNGVQAVYTA